MRRTLMVILALLLLALPALAEERVTVVGCESYITLREAPDPAAPVLAELPLGSTAVRIGETDNAYSRLTTDDGLTGYALAPYLLPEGSEPPRRSPFAAADLTLGDLPVVGTTSRDILARFGPPDRIGYEPQAATGEGHVHFAYDDAITFAFIGDYYPDAAEGEAAYAVTDGYALPLFTVGVLAQEIPGPRGLFVGQSMGETLAPYPVANPVMLNGEDMLFYADGEGDDARPPYGKLRLIPSHAEYTGADFVAMPEDIPAGDDWRYQNLCYLQILFTENRVTSYTLVYDAMGE